MTPPPQLPTGSGCKFPALYNWLNWLRAYCISLTPVQSSSVRTAHTAKGVSRESAVRAAGGGASVDEYTLVSVNADDLTCTDSNDNEVTIRKPYLLRRTPFEGQSVSYTIENWPSASTTAVASYTFQSNTFRTATISGATEKQCIIPRYRPGVLIYATTLPDGTLLDINADARAWSRAF
jgi:hypothetical protein